MSNVKPRHDQKAKLHNMNTDSFNVYIKSRWCLQRHCRRCWN